MGRTILAEEFVQQYIEKLLKSNKWFTGVIIGQQTLQRDYVVHIARTPDPVEDEASEENAEEECGDGSKKQSLERPASLDKLDDKWVSTHAKQVSRMLPGGLSVIGLFVVAPTAMLTANQMKSKQMLFSIHKSLTKNQMSSPSSSEINDRILLQIDSTTKKMTCVTLDVSDSKSTARSADWKYQSSGTKWVRLDSHINLNIHFAIPKEEKSQALMKQLQVGLGDFGKSLEKAIMAVDGVIREGEETLLVQDKSKGKAGRDKGDVAAKPTASRINLFLPYPESASSLEPVTSESQAVIKIIGRIAVRAFVSAKATVTDAFEAVRTDIMRSLLARYELLFEEFDVTDENTYNQVYDPPIRLFCPLPHCGIDVCDYSFQDEKKEEVVERIQELLDLVVDRLEDVEKSAGEDSNWSQQSSLTCMSSTHSLASSGQETSTSSLKSVMGAAVGGLVALAAAGLSYLYMND